jgi:hypothetical protein
MLNPADIRLRNTCPHRQLLLGEARCDASIVEPAGLYHECVARTR